MKKIILLASIALISFTVSAQKPANNTEKSKPVKKEVKQEVKQEPKTTEHKCTEPNKEHKCKEGKTENKACCDKNKTQAKTEQKGCCDKSKDQKCADKGKDHKCADKGKDQKGCCDKGKDQKGNCDKGKDHKCADKGKDHNCADKGKDGKCCPEGKGKDANCCKDGENNGNAYGHHKDGQCGRDFGQQRAQAAKNKVEKEKVVKEVATEVDQKVVNTKNRVQEARTAVETKYKKKQITKAQYEEKMKRIDEIEKDVQRIETERQATDKVIKSKVS